jgi:PAS domain S-box-containing protein
MWRSRWLGGTGRSRWSSPSRPGAAGLARDSLPLRDVQEAAVAGRAARFQSAPMSASSNDPHRLLVEKSPAMMWRSGLDAERDYFNTAWLAFTGRPLEQERGGGWAEGIHAEDLDRCLRFYRNHFERREPFEMEYRLRRRDGMFRYVLDRGAPFEENGAFRGFIGSCLDIHERREAEEARETYLRMMAHELRTPLQSIKVYAEILRRGAAAGRPYQKEAFEKLEAQFERLSRLVGDLSEAGRLKDLFIKSEALDLGALLRKLVEIRTDQLRVASERLRHTLQFEQTGGPASVRGDCDRLEQAFANLLDNALKYSPRGGAIRVSLESIDGFHRIAVKDEGIGIPRHEIPLVTRRFFRGSNVSVHKYPGVGLGLSMANEIVARHGGSLAIESEVGSGTVVTIRLPVAEWVPP